MKKPHKRIYLFDKVPFDRITRSVFIRTIIQYMLEKKKRLVLNMNAYGVVTYLENKKYAEIIGASDIIYPDGWGPVFASRGLKYPLKERINVGDFIDQLLTEMNDNKLRLYLLGSEEKVVILTANSIKIRYPNIVIVGFHHGFFNKRDEEKITKEIKSSKPNLVLVGMGLPIQEYFISENWENLPNAVFMGIGSAFHYIARIKSRAPKWMRDSGWEWLYRFMQEPIRLSKRYTIYNIKFLYYLGKFLILKNYESVRH